MIIPTHNRAELLEENISSLLCQDYPDFELVYVNDSSTDSTGEVLGRVRERFPDLVKVVDVRDRAPGPARNAGVDSASGDLILFTDDDVSPPANWISSMVTAHAASGSEALCCHAAPQSQAGKVERYLYLRSQIPLGWADRPVSSAPMMGFLISKAAFVSAGGFSSLPLRSCEDCELTRRLWSRGQTVRYISTISVLHRYSDCAKVASAKISASGSDGLAIWILHGGNCYVLAIHTLLRLVASPFCLLFFYPADLYWFALQMEFCFARSRMGAFGRWITGKPVTRSFTGQAVEINAPHRGDEMRPRKSLLPSVVSASSKILPTRAVKN